MYSTLFGLVLVVMLFTLSNAFHTPFQFPQGLRRPYKQTIITCNAEPGKLLYDAAYAGNIEKMKQIITEAKGDKKILNWNSPERYGRTPLVIASYYGKVEAGTVNTP